ncbi:magnesium transporter [Pseudonocardia nematodicida]|uniref:Magnesium transporter MgtE n=1 Tax=Pseudonocardia nematodicida TaxID=1206997 RepID=A0ABV1KKX8_9PSEU
MERLTDLVARHDAIGVRDWLDDRPPHEIADELARLEPVGAGWAFRLLDKDRALSAFEELDPVDQQELLGGLRDDAAVALVERMDPDDRARMLGEAPAKVATRMLAGLSSGEQAMTATLLGYPDGSVGREMSPETVAVPVQATVTEALAVVRRKGADAETVYTLPVTDAGRTVLGTVSLRELVLARPQARVADLVDTGVPRVQATDPAEYAARLMGEANLLALLVVDSEDRLLGLLTIDDAVEILEEADTEDAARQSGATPWSGHYMYVRVTKLARTRALWLAVLLLAAVLTVNVLQLFEDSLEQVTALALFIPLLVGTGGNAGAQAASAAVRAIAVGEVRLADLPAVVWRELRVGLLLGALLGGLGLVVASVLVGVQIAGVVAVTLVAICGWAATVGATMPLLARRLGIDPAVVSAPLVTTLVDATGLLIYFSVARLLLGV